LAAFRWAGDIRRAGLLTDTREAIVATAMRRLRTLVVGDCSDVTPAAPACNAHLGGGHRKAKVHATGAPASPQNVHHEAPPL
jgi:hypothetical protein